MSRGNKLVAMADRVYHRMRHPDAFSAASSEATAEGFDGLRGHKYCLLVSYKRSGEPVPTPVWFGLDGEGRALVRTEADCAKVRRIRANAHVRLAAATARGKPVGPPAEGTARELAPDEHARAEAVLAASYGLGRKLYEGMSGPLGVQTTYLEVAPGWQQQQEQDG